MRIEKHLRRKMKIRNGTTIPDPFDRTTGSAGIQISGVVTEDSYLSRAGEILYRHSNLCPGFEIITCFSYSDLPRSDLTSAFQD